MRKHPFSVIALGVVTGKVSTLLLILSLSMFAQPVSASNPYSGDPLNPMDDTISSDYYSPPDSITVHTFWDPKRQGMIVVVGNRIINQGPFQRPNAQPAVFQELEDMSPSIKNEASGDANEGKGMRTKAEYKYDPCDRRISVKENGREKIIFYDGSTPCSNRVLNEYYSDGKGPNVRYLWAGNELVAAVRDGKVEYYHYDANGNVVAVSDEKGKVIEQNSYDPYGNSAAPGKSNNSSIGFVGAYGVRQDRSTGLDYMGHRYYDPDTGTFLSADSVTYPFDKYTYCYNNPVRYIDPKGEQGELALGWGLAFAEPTPFGEIIMTGVTIGVGVATILNMSKGGKQNWKDSELEGL